jgi:hypothetical protein
VSPVSIGVTGVRDASMGPSPTPVPISYVSDISYVSYLSYGRPRHRPSSAEPSSASAFWGLGAL